MTQLVRSAVLMNYAEVARHCGLDPAQMLRWAELPAACLEQHDLMIPAENAYRLIEESALRCGVESFGLQLAETRRLSTLGVLGMLAREEPTLRHVIHSFIRYGRLHNEALILTLEESGGTAVLRQELMLEGSHTASPKRQCIEVGVTMLYRVLRFFLGPDWQPRAVCLMHPPPQDRTVHWRVLGRNLVFSSEFNGIACAVADLDKPIASSDPIMAQQVRRQVEALHEETRAHFSHQVRELVLTLLPAGRCTLEQVAAHLGINRRTVHRYLLREKLTFSDIVNSVRSELAARYLEVPERSLAEVSELLGFSAPSAFSRWYRLQFGISAKAHRRTQSEPPAAKA